MDWLTVLIVGIIVLAIGYIIKRIIADAMIQKLGYALVIIGIVIIVISMILLIVSFV